MTSPETQIPEHSSLYALADAEPIVVCHIVYNPLNLSQRSTGNIAWFATKTLADYLDGLPEGVECGVAVNGVPVDKKDWAERRLNPGDHIVVVPIPEGGGNGKSIFRLVAMIAFAVIGAYVAAPIVGSLELTGNMASIGLSAVKGIVSAVGGMLVNAMMPAPKAKTPEKSDLTSQSASYGIDGPKNTSTEDVTVPVVYGEFRVAGNLTAIQTENVDDAQYLKLMSVVSEGRIESITGFEINQQPIANYIGIETQTRLGLDEQPICDWFASTTRQINKNITLNHENWVVHSTESEVDQVRIDLVMPQGVGYIKDDGGIEERTIVVDVEYRRLGTTDWLPMDSATDWNTFTGDTSPANSAGLRLEVTPTLTPTLETYEIGDNTYNVRVWDIAVEYSTDGGVNWTRFGSDAGAESRWYYGDQIQNKTFEVNGLEKGAYMVRAIGGTIANRWCLQPVGTEITGAQRKTMRRTYLTPVLQEDFYEVRVKRRFAAVDDGRTLETVILSDVGEVINEQIAYNGTAYYGLRIKLSDQINQLPQVSALVKGVRVAHFDQAGNFVSTKWSNNPAWIALDILTNTHYGAAIPVERFDMPKWFEWAEWCQKRGFEFNGIFDYKTNVWDALQSVLRVGHAQIIRVGTRYSLALEKPSTPTMMFGSGNIVADSFSIEWLSMEDRANEIEINYYDRDDSFRRKVVRVIDEVAYGLGRPQKVASITLQGVTNYKQARYEGYFQMALNRLIQQTITFDAPIEAIACSVGDLILVQHEMPQWGVAGRTEAGSTDSVVKLDRTVTMESGKTYKLFVLHSAVQRGSATVQLVSGRSVMVSGMPAGRVTRIRHAGADIGVARAIPGAWTELILSDDPTGITNGSSIEIWDTDVIEERGVTGVGDFDEIDVGASLAQAPAAYSNWMFGEVTKVAKIFRVQSISGSGVETRTISAIEYNESAFLDPEAANVPGNYEGVPAQIGHVSVDTAREERLTPDGMVARVWFSWKRPRFGVYAGADVYVSVNGDPLIQFTTVTNAGTTFSFDAAARDKLQVRLVAIDADGNRPPVDTAPIFEYTVLGAGTPPQAPYNLVAVGGIRSVSLNWENPADTTVDHIEVWRSTTPDRDAAVKAADVWGNTFTNNGLLGVTDYWFWIRSANKLGLVSEWNSEMGTSARTQPLDSQDIADAIIGRSKLIPELAEKIDLIDTAGIERKIDDALAGIGLPDTEALSEALLTAITTGYEHFEEIKTSRGITDRRAAFVDTKITELESADSSLAQQITTVAAEFDDQLAVVTDTLIAQATEDAALSSRITTLQAQVDSDIAAAIATEQTARADADAAIASSVTTLAARVDTAEAGIVSEQTARADGDAALASSIDTLLTRMGTAEAAIVTEQSVRASGDSANASSISTLQSTVNDQTTAIQQVISTTNGLSAQYTVKIDNNGYVAGFGLASTPINGVPFSEFIVRADAFAVVHPGYPALIPFGVYDGKVTMDAAYIREATVDTLHLKNGSVSYAGVALSGELFLTGGVQTCASFSMTTIAMPVFIMSCITARAGAVYEEGSKIQNEIRARLMIDGTDTTGWVPLGMGTNAISAFYHNVSAGTHSFEIQVQGGNYAESIYGSSNGVARAFIFAQQIKR